MFTRRHFKAIAENLRTTKPNADISPEGYNQWVYTVDVMATMCREANRNFNRGLFLAACGVTEEED